MDNEDKALKQSLNNLVNEMSKADIGVLVSRVQMLEDHIDLMYERSRDGFLQVADALAGIIQMGAAQELAIKNLIWNKPEQALAALRGELKDSPSVNSDPV